MISYHSQGSILDSTADYLVNPVNCVGVQGAGLAKAFVERFGGSMRSELSFLSRRGYLRPGSIQFSEWHPVVYFATKDHWRDPSRLDWIHRGLSVLPAALIAHRARSVAIPMLGCGLGGLDRNEVQAEIERAALLMPNIRTEIYA